ncbi:hypothetical protein NST41_14360 [Paenibacillus sp. FSL L8-0696]|uniref:hypothetical protein n=1 Tax=Paenibacillus sp. FSL L8-0696 TaxID=2954524 RepID=UPI003119F9EE
MANVQLPTIDTTEADIKVLVPQLLNAYAKLTKELTWLLNNLDTRNVNELNAEKIVAKSITAGKLAADSVETENLIAGAVTADKITVNELSAITANLGHITAGLIESIEIYGSYIATRKTGYPKAELNDNGDLVAVWTDAENYVTIEPGLFNEPTIVYRRNGASSLILGPVGVFTGLISPNLDMSIGSQNGTLSLLCGSGILAEVQIPSWEKFRGVANGVTLADELASKANAGASTGSGGGANAGIPIGTKLALDGGGYVVWNGIPSHSHTQT